MGQFRKKPIVIEAVQWTGLNWPDVHAMMTKGDQRMSFVDAHLRIYTTEGVMIATRGDWIIKGIAGEFYPCKPDIFAATYEPA